MKAKRLLNLWLQVAISRDEGRRESLGFGAFPREGEAIWEDQNRAFELQIALSGDEGSLGFGAFPREKKILRLR